MRDRFFYPIALAVVVGLVLSAILPGLTQAREHEQAVIKNGLVLEGNDLRTLETASPNFLEYAVDTNGDVDHVVLYSNLARTDAIKSAGVFRALGGKYECIFGGQDLEIIVRARASSQNPLKSFDLAYFTGAVGDSGWYPYELTPSYQDYVLKFSPKAPKGPPGRDYIGIWPGKDGNSKKMDVESIRVKIIAR